jgi:Tol biopolymer transport system component
VVVAGAVLSSLAMASSQATAETKNGAIAFSGKRGTTRVIYSRDADGRRLRSLRIPGRSGDPAFSPLGRRLAFTRHGLAGAQVWITYPGGLGLRQLTSGPADGLAAWSSDGAQVTFARGRRGGRDIYRVISDGTSLRRLTFYRGDDHSPSWSVTNQIAFVRRLGGKDKVYVMSALGGRPRRLTRGDARDTAPAWSRTGRYVLVARGRPGRRDLYLVRANGSRSRRLTKVKGDETDPAWSPDGTRIVFAHKRGKSRRLYVMKWRGKAVTKLPRRSRRVRRLTSSGSNSATPSWQLAGADPVVAAAGDIACDPTYRLYNGSVGVSGACRQKLTSDLLLRLDLSSILMLGDGQYEHGELAKWQQSFNPTWGRLKGLIRPVPGNHEYQTPGAAGYFDYFNGVGAQTGPAGERTKGYYSFDIGTWHVIALNSECRQIGGCGPTSPQVQWLRADLAAHPAACTLAYWHRPRFTSGTHTAEGDVLSLWNVLYAAHADLILTGHEHFYERFARQTPAGTPDPALGIRQITAGMGGRSHHGFVRVAPNSEVRDNRTTGVLKLTLREGGYDWELLRAPFGRADAGSDSCR